ncbi:rve domain containing protein [Pyrenophora tritici-repentis]|uniref:Rve domain containing protein n=1 Tax=Pyrenophora tritici-repentis TaxID=45151 RepID=A0A922N606_9PLEO|nr:rve domain containing protein [Pyrenophora tritici-repentis]
MSTQFPDGNAADAPHVGDASGSDANPTAGATISPGKSARSFARPTVASTARSSALPRATGSANLRQISNPAVPGAFGNEQLEQQGYDADSDNDEADITQIHHLVPSRPLSPVVDAQDSSDSFQPSPPNVTTTRGRAGFQYPALRQRSDAQRTDNPFTYQTEDGNHTSYALSPPTWDPLPSPTPRTEGTTSKPVRKVIGYVIPKTDLPQGSQPTLAAYEYDANGEPRLVGELDEAFVKGSTTEAGEKLYQFCFDTVHTLHNDLANLQERLTDAREDLIDERVAKLNSEKQVKFLTNQLQEVRGSLHVANQDLQSKLDTAERRAERYLQRKEEYKTALNQESTAHGETKEKLKAYASTARPSLRGKPHDSISDESDGPVSVRRHRSATKLSPDAPLPATTQRRSKQPEPAVFEGPTGTKASTYQKWKLDMQSWFRAHPYPFANNEEEQLDYIRMKTTGVAWDNISSGWFVEGDEFHTAQEAWDILDACYGRLNTRLDAHNFYEKEGFMKPGETITSYLARFKAGVAPLKWDDEEKTLQAYKKLPDQWRSRAEHLMSDDTFTKDFAKFSHKLRHLEQLHSALQPSHNPSKGNSGGSGRGGGGNNRNRNRNADNAQPKGSGANQFIINKPYRERTVMETQVLAELERCFKCTRAGHKSNSDDAPCKDMDKLTSMGRYPEVLTALNEARKAAGVPIPKAAGPQEPEKLNKEPLNTPEPTTPPSPTAEDCDDNDTEPDPTLQAILDRIKNLERPAAPRVRVSAIAAAAIRGNTYLPMVGQQLVFKGMISPSQQPSSHVELMGDSGCASLFIDESHARAHKYELIPLQDPAVLELADGTQVANVTHMTRVHVTFDTHHEQVLAYVTKVSGVQMILGTPWFQIHNPQVNWDTMSIVFNSDHCIRNCLENHKPCMAASSRHRKHPAPPAYELKKARHPKAPQHPPPIDIAFISSRVAAISVTRGEQVCLTSMEEVERLCNMTDQEWTDTQLLRAAGAKVLPEDFEKFRDRMERPHMSKEEILAKLPEVLHPLYHGFDPREADEIPPQRDKLDHAIEIHHEAIRLAGLCLGEAECDLPSILSLMHESGEGMSRVGTAMVRLARLTLQGQHDPYDDLVAADEMTTQEIVDALYPTDARLTAIRDALNNGHRRIPHHLIAEGVRLELGDLETNAERKLFMRYNRLLVPFSEKLRTRIIKDIHDSLPGGHGGRTTTYQQVSQWYYWQGMTDTIARFTNNCTTCRRSKVNRHAKHGLLHPLPVPEKYWTDISIDFITPLPPSKWCGHSYRHIMVVVDRLSKKKKFIAIENMEVLTIVDKFLEYIWREEGYPKTLVSDRGRQFTSHFWRRLCDRVGTAPKLSTAYHPETDGQTENANADLKQYLRSYVNYLQDDWAQLLPLAEFEANSAISSATGVSPFQATKGYQPRSGLEPAHAITNATPAAAQRRAADSLTNRIDATRRYLRDEIAWTQERMKDFADVHRHPAPRFAVGDWVLLNAKHIKTERPVKSLDHKNMGPYQITRVIDNMAYELDLPDSLKNIFPAFHPWLLQPYEDDALPGQPRANDNAPPEVHLNDEGDTEYVIAQVLDSRIRNTMNDPYTGRRGCLQYKVEWVGNDQSEGWQPYFNLRGSKESVQDFHDRNPGRPGPHATFHDYDDNGQLAVALLCVFNGSLNAQSGI